MSVALALIAGVSLQPPQTLGEVPFRIGEEAIIVDAAVNGKNASFMFDTGFSGSVILNDAINIGKASGTMTLRDFVGTFQARTVKVASLKLGSMAIDSKEMEAVQQPLAHMTDSYNTHTDGIMGFEVIKNYVTKIDFQNKRFVFYPKSHDITKFKPDNEKTFLARLLPTGHNSLEMEVVAENGGKMVLALDTGNAFFATTHKDVLERVGLWETGKKPVFMKTAWVASGPVDSWYKQMNNLTIYGVKVPKSFWSIIDLPASSADGDGTIGFGFLKNFNITIDYDRRRVWLENFTGEVGNELPGEPGLFAAYDARIKRVRVYGVSPDGPAAKAGIKAGDHVLSIEGKDLANLGFREISRMLEGPVGTKVKMALSRNGNLMRYEIDRVQLTNP